MMIDRQIPIINSHQKICFSLVNIFDSQLLDYYLEVNGEKIPKKFTVFTFNINRKVYLDTTCLKNGWHDIMLVGLSFDDSWHKIKLGEIIININNNTNNRIHKRLIRIAEAI